MTKDKLSRENEDIGKQGFATRILAASFCLNFSAELGGHITEGDPLLLYKEMYHHLEDLFNSVKCYFPKDEFVTCQHHSWVKDPFKV